MRRPAIASLFLVAFPSVVLAEDVPVPPERAAALMTLPEGFRATLYAGEPDIVKPIAMTLDDRGRLWVVESHSYPKWITDGKPGRDRVVIFEGEQPGGRFAKKTVFLDNGTNLSGIALGFGGVWLCATPNLLFIPVRPGEDRPAGTPQVILDGWDLKAQHNVFNGVTWGPDGWLYGCNGILSNSRVGRPGTPDKDRVAFNCGVWRYHPTKQVFQVFAWGTTNPWGLDFDERGEAFITNCVIKHLFHVVPGGHYERMFGQDVNPHCYGLLPSCADHFHWAGGAWTASRGGQGAHSDRGGGHAHAGCMIYLGDNWPDEYRGHVFMCNIHGNRVNQDVLERRGSGYVAKHGPDFLLAHDPWFRGLSLLYGPDGGVYLSDWHDTGECHNYDKTHPSGRIYRIVYGKPKPADVDLVKLGDMDLVRLQLHKNEWYVRHARRLLQERAHVGKLDVVVKPALQKMLDEQKDVTRQLRALWALHCVGGLDEKALLRLLDHKEDDVRGWAVRLLTEDGRVSEPLAARLAKVAAAEKSAAVRLALASALPRIDLEQRLPLALALAARGEDKADANLPLMIWYGTEALTPRREHETDLLLAEARIPLVRRYVARRLAGMEQEREWLGLLLGISAAAPDRRAMVRDILQGMNDGLQGQGRLRTVWDWTTRLQSLFGSPDVETAEAARLLAARFGDREAIAALRRAAGDVTAPAAKRETALQTLVDAKAPGISRLIRDLLADKSMRGAALRALATLDDPDTPALILQHYASFTDAEKADAVATLASRPAYASALLDAIGKGQVQRRDLSPFVARQILALKDQALSDKLAKVWGTLRPPQDKSVLMAKYLGLVPPEALQKADRAHGRLVFTKNCATCHTLFGEGAKIGPELTGSQRANPEYLLTKLLDPSATVAKDFQVTVFFTKAGRTITGLIKEENDQVVAVQTPTEVVRLAKADIEAREQSPQSLMPADLLEKLSDAEVRDLFAYLAGDGPVK